MKDGDGCEMKGFLSFLILWVISKESMTGAQVATELEKRKGVRPSPGTVYPALKYLKEKSLIKSNREKEYVLTPKGKKELNKSLGSFFSIFCDIDEMSRCRPR